MVARRESRSSRRDDRGGGRGERDRDRGSDRRSSRGSDRGSRREREPEEREEDRDRGRDRGRSSRDDDRGSRRNDRDRDDRRDRRTPSKSSYVYKPRDPEAVKRRAEAKRGGQFDSIFKQGYDTITLAQGDNTIRVLPPTWENHDDCAYVIWTHNYVGADESTYLCPRKMLQEECPICTEAKKAKDDGDEDDWKHLRAQQRAVVWCIDRDDKADPPKPMLYNMYYGQWQDILKVSIDRKKGSALDFDDPNVGYDLNISRSGQGARTRYSGFSFDREPSPIDDDQDIQDDLITHVEENPIPDCLNFFDADYLERVINGTTPERDKDAAPEEEERGSGRRGRDREEEEPEERGRRAARDEEDRDRGGRRDRDRDRDPPEEDRDERDPPEEEEEGRSTRGRSRGRDREEDPDPPPPRRGRAERDPPEERSGRSERGSGRRYRD